MNIEELQEVAHSELPISPTGMAIDINDRIWIHNHINNKLMTFDTLLHNDKEYDGNDAEYYVGNSTVWPTDDLGKVYWFKGAHEGLVLSGADGSISDEIDYLVDQTDMIQRISQLENPKHLLVITNSKTKEEAVFQRVVNNSGTCKSSKKVSYADSTEGSRFNY